MCIRDRFYEGQLGTERTVLFEDEVVDGNMQGFTENYVRVTAKYDPLLINEVKRLQLIEINAEGQVEVREVETEVFHH